MSNLIKQRFEQEAVKQKFQEVLGKKATAFMVSALQVVNSNDLLKNADPDSVLNAVMTSATLDLPINSNLGYAYVIPYTVKQKDGSFKQMAQFQMGWKGFVQLAQRSGQYLTISSSPVYDGQLVDEDPLKGYTFNWKVKSEKVIGFVAYFKLVNGFEKQLFMTVEQLERHGKKFSKTFAKGFGLWKDDFNAMASKTVIKLLLSKYGVLSVEMQEAIIRDQAVMNEGEVMYADNEEVTIDKELERVRLLIDQCQSADELATLKAELKDFDLDIDSLFIDRLKQLTNAES